MRRERLFRLVAGGVMLPLLLVMATGCRRDAADGAVTPTTAAVAAPTATPAPEAEAQGPAIREIDAIMAELVAGQVADGPELDMEDISKEQASTADLGPLVDEASEMARELAQPSPDVDFGP